MRNILYFVLLCSFITFSFSIQENNDPFYHILQKVKKIDPQASPEEYQILFQELQKNNLSVNKCVELLLERKKEKGFKSTRYFNDENKAIIKKIHAKQQAEDAHKKIKLVVHLSPDINLSQEEKKEISATFSDRYSVTLKNAEEIYDRNRLYKNSDLSALEGTCCRRRIQNLHSNDLTAIIPGSYHVYIGIDFVQATPNKRKAMLLHEKKHMENNHQVLLECLEKMIEKNIKVHDPHKPYFLPGNTQSKAFSRALEAEADRLAIISSDLATAACFNDYITDDEIESEIEDEEIAKFKAHQRFRKRAEWFLRLYNLKKAEEIAQQNGSSSCIQGAHDSHNLRNLNTRLAEQNIRGLHFGMKLLPIPLAILKSKKFFCNLKNIARKPL